MNMTQRIIPLIFLLVFSVYGALAQNQEEQKIAKHRIVKQNGVSFVGTIVSQDAREVLIETVDMGEVYIPKHEIREIKLIEAGERLYEEGGLFSTRYFLTTNGFPVKKGENYVQWNLFGPDFQFGVADNFGMGIMTSWVGMPIIGTAKYSRQLGKKLSAGVGFLGGTGSWAFPQYGLLLPFGFMTFGDRVNNINFTGGYGALFLEESESSYRILDIPTEWETNQVEYDHITSTTVQSRPLFSVAGMFKINSKFSFVFDSFIMLAGNDKEYQYVDQTYNDRTGKYTNFIRTETQKAYPLVVISPGLRFQANEMSSIQFGFTGVHFEGEFVPVPIPMIQWFRAI